MYSFRRLTINYGNDLLIGLVLLSWYWCRPKRKRMELGSCVTSFFVGWGKVIHTVLIGYRTMASLPYIDIPGLIDSLLHLFTNRYPGDSRTNRGYLLLGIILAISKKAIENYYSHVSIVIVTFSNIFLLSVSVIII